MNRVVFRRNVIALSDETFVSASACVYDAPGGFSSKPSLVAVYGNDLFDLFQRILTIPYASATEALAYLQLLRSDARSTMATVAGVYNYLQNNCAST
jgi:hypothetical protein